MFNIFYRDKTKTGPVFSETNPTQIYIFSNYVLSKSTKTYQPSDQKLSMLGLDLKKKFNKASGVLAEGRMFYSGLKMIPSDFWFGCINIFGLNQICQQKGRARHEGIWFNIANWRFREGQIVLPGYI